MLSPLVWFWAGFVTGWATEHAREGHFGPSILADVVWFFTMTGLLAGALAMLPPGPR